MSRPLRLLLTRDAEGCRVWGERLHRLGVESVALPCLEIRAIADPRMAESLVEALASARWLVLTSPRGVDAVAQLLDAAKAPSNSGLRIAAVGPSTAAQTRRHFERVDYVAQQATAADLARELWSLEGPGLSPLVLATADRGRDELYEFLGGKGVEVRRFDVYRTSPVAPAGRPQGLVEHLCDRGVERSRAEGLDGILLASPSAVEGLLNRVELPRELPLITLGPTTSAALEHRGYTVAAQAREPSLESLLASASTTLSSLSN